MFELSPTDRVAAQLEEPLMCVEADSRPAQRPFDDPVAVARPLELGFHRRRIGWTNAQRSLSTSTIDVASSLLHAIRRIRQNVGVQGHDSWVLSGILKRRSTLWPSGFGSRIASTSATLNLVRQPGRHREGRMAE